MPDTFAPAPMGVIDNAAAQRFGQVYAAATELVTKQKAQELHDAAFTAGVRGILEERKSHTAIDGAFKQPVDRANPVAEEAIRKAGYVQASRSIYKDLNAEWQHSDMVNKHPDVFAGWLREQLPGRMKTYNVDMDDPDAARYFVPQMEQGFRSLTNQHNQQYIARTNAMVRNDFATNIRAITEEYVTDAGSEGVNTVELGKALEAQYVQGGYTGIPGGERDMLLVNNLAAQAVSYASNTQTLGEADRLLAAADTIRNGEFAKSAKVQDVLRDAHKAVVRAQGAAVEAHGKKVTADSEAAADKYANAAIMALNDNNIADAINIHSVAMANPNILPEHKMCITKAYSDRQTFLTNIAKLTAVNTDMNYYNRQMGALQTNAKEGKWGANQTLMRDMSASGVVSGADLGAADKARVGYEQASKDARLRETGKAVSAYIQTATHVPTPRWGIASKAERDKAAALENQLNILWLQVLGEDSQFKNPDTDAIVAFRDLAPSQQATIFVTKADALVKLNTGHTAAELANTPAQAAAAIAKEAAQLRTKEQTRLAIIAVARQATNDDNKQCEADFLVAIAPLMTTTWEDPLKGKTEWVPSSTLLGYAASMVRTHQVDSEMVEAQRNAMVGHLEAVAQSGHIRTQEQAALLDGALALVHGWANLHNAYANDVNGLPAIERLPDMQSTNAKSATYKVSAVSAMGRMLIDTNNLSTQGFMHSPSPMPGMMPDMMLPMIVNTEPRYMTNPLGGLESARGLDHDAYVTPADFNKAIRDAMDRIHVPPVALQPPPPLDAPME